MLPYPYYQTTREENGITFTDNGDGTITASGVASDYAHFIFLDTSMLHSYSNVLVSGIPQTIAGVSVGLYINGSWSGILYDGEVLVPSGSNLAAMVIEINPNTDLSTPITFYPMIRPVGTDSTYVPYAMPNNELSKRVEYEGDGVRAIKAGYTVTVSVAKTTTTFSVGWNVLGTLPSAFRSKKTIRFNGLDDNITVWGESLCLPLMISTNGEVKVWGFNSHLTTSIVGCITYIV